MTARPWMPFYIGDYLADTGHLNTTQHGAYLLLIMHYWRMGGLPEEDRQLANITRLPLRIWQDIKPVIQDFFQDGWKHGRIEFEMTEAARASETAKKAGLASGRARRRKNVANDRSASVERKPNETPTPTLTTKEVYSEAKASGGEAPPTYSDDRHELWGEGLALLGQLGISDRAARSNIGRWLRDTRDDIRAVLGAIRRCRDQRVIDPIPWITQALGSVNGHANRGLGANSVAGSRPADTNPIVAGVAKLAERRMRVHDQREDASAREPDSHSTAA